MHSICTQHLWLPWKVPSPESLTLHAVGLCVGLCINHYLLQGEASPMKVSSNALTNGYSAVSSEVTLLPHSSSRITGVGFPLGLWPSESQVLASINTISALIGCLYHTSPLSRLRIYVKDFKSQGWWMIVRRKTHPRHNRADDHMNSQRLYSTVRPAQAEARQSPNTGKEKWTQSPTTNREATATDSCGERDDSPLEWQYLSSSARQASCSGVT